MYVCKYAKIKTIHSKIQMHEFSLLSTLQWNGLANFSYKWMVWWFFFAFLWFFFPYAPFLVTSYILLSWNKEIHILKSNFLSSQMNSHSFSPSSLPLHKAKWVQLNGKTLQVLKNSLRTRISEVTFQKGFFS